MVGGHLRHRHDHTRRDWDEHDEEETNYLPGCFDDFAEHFGLKRRYGLRQRLGFLCVHVTFANHHIEQIRVVTAVALKSPPGMAQRTGEG